MAVSKQEPSSKKVREGKATDPKGIWIKCDSCKEILYKREVERNSHVCPKCQRHFRIGSREWVQLLLDPETFQEIDARLRPLDPLGFKDSKAYPERVKLAKKETGLEDAFLSGVGTISGHRVVVGVMEFFFMGGSMGSVVGEKIARAVERAITTRSPLILVSCSGGARMQEGVLSLMQMAKTSAALARLGRAGIAYIPSSLIRLRVESRPASRCWETSSSPSPTPLSVSPVHGSSRTQSARRCPQVFSGPSSFRNMDSWISSSIEGSSARCRPSS